MGLIRQALGRAGTLPELQLPADGSVDVVSDAVLSILRIQLAYHLTMYH